tara:strand:+ start:21363 stop:22220 length:858 start_codon:yes stop_codon:yes gene_type:complete
MISFNYLASPGQLGNQMFKYAALRGISNFLNKDFLMPPSNKFLNNKNLFKVAYKLNLADSRNHVNHVLFEYFNMKSVQKNNIGYSDFGHSIKESGFSFDNRFFNKDLKDFDIYGFFQSYKYFSEVDHIVKNDFVFKNNFKNNALKIISKINDPISIHVRRGDYLTNPNHSALDIQYYERSIDYFGKNKNFIIFSDDILWCKNVEIFQNENIFFADDFTGGKEQLDMCLMSLCDRHIIANSTFSWWGAWLSNQEEVLAPSNWFKNSAYSNYETKDLYPLKWKKIEN